MANINKADLKAYFETGKIPTQSNFADLIDSFMNIPSGEGKDSTLVMGSGDKTVLLTYRVIDLLIIGISILI